jgi:hypothetical protein
MRTVLIIAFDPGYDGECQSAFAAAGLYAVVVPTLERALAVLRQFKADVLVIEEGPARDREDLPPVLPPALDQLRIFRYPTLPAPPILAADVGDMSHRIAVG